MSRRGVTLVELTLVMALTACLLGALGSLFAFGASRASGAVARTAALTQAQGTLSDVASIIGMSENCTSITTVGRSYLKCTLPANCTDTDGDGYPERCSLDHVGRRGGERWGQGWRVWFFQSDLTGNPALSGPIFWRARRADDAMITSSDVDQSWTLYYGGGLRRPLLTGLSCSVNGNDLSVTLTVSADSLTRADRSASAADLSAGDRAVTLTRTVYWRNSKL